MESALPTAYENGAYYFMTKKTFMQFVGMTDDNGQPIARVNYGIGGKPERVLLGRGVKLLDDYMSSYAATQSADIIIAFIFRPEDYTLNTNLNITVKTYEDNDTDDKITASDARIRSTTRCLKAWSPARKSSLPDMIPTVIPMC